MPQDAHETARQAAGAPRQAPIPPAPRRYGAVNWIGLGTLVAREVRRFLKVGMQTVAAPVVTTLLLLWSSRWRWAARCARSRACASRSSWPPAS